MGAGSAQAAGPLGGAAPLLGDALPKSGGSAEWIRASDGVRLRLGLFLNGGARGLAIVSPGRTEFIEKHAETVDRLHALGFDAAVIDWRGQGLSDRALPDRRKGHVVDFAEYQRDLDAALSFLAADHGDRPWLLLAHSMGGCIGARALMRQTGRGGGAPWPANAPPFRAAIFSAPMLRLHGSASFYAAGRVGAEAMVAVGRGDAYVAGGGPTSLAEGPFEGNLLTSDPQRFERYAGVALAHRELLIGGPTWGWLRAALREMRAVRAAPVPSLVAVGDKERVVAPAAARLYAETASKLGAIGAYVPLPGARHEPLMETDAVQDRFWSAAAEHLSACGL